MPDQLASLVAHIGELQEDVLGHLILHVQSVILDVGRPQILVDAVDGKGWLRRGASKNELVLFHDHQIGIPDAEDGGRAGRLARNSAPRIRAGAVVNKQVAIDNVVVDAVVTADHPLAAPLGSEGEAETGGEVVVISRIQRVEVLADDGQTAGRRRQENRDGLVAYSVQPAVVGVAQPVIDVEARRRLPVILRPPLE